MRPVFIHIIIFLSLFFSVSGSFGAERRGFPADAGDSTVVNLPEPVLCTNVSVVARQRFPADSFFLFYPLPDRSWRLAGENRELAFVPEGSSCAYFSSADTSGTMNIRVLHFRDSVQSSPELSCEKLNSPYNEILPMLSPDGGRLYFASDRPGGYGGYDLYCSEADPDSGEWGEPVNMGMPFNSSGDDLLFADTEDLRYSLFASNRSCGTDNLYIYVIEYEAERSMVQVYGEDELQALLELTPKRDPRIMDNASAVSDNMPENDAIRNYQQKVNEARVLQDEVRRTEKKLNEMKALLLAGEDTEDMIVDLDEQCRRLKDALAEVQADIRIFDREFLRGGVVLDSDMMKQKADRIVVGASLGYTFTRNDMGPDLPLPSEEDEKIIENGEKTLYLEELNGQSWDL